MFSAAEMTGVVAHVDPFRPLFPVHRQLTKDLHYLDLFLYTGQEFETCYEVPNGGRSFKQIRVVRLLQYKQAGRQGTVSRHNVIKMNILKWF